MNLLMRVLLKARSSLWDQHISNKEIISYLWGTSPLTAIHKSVSTPLLTNKIRNSTCIHNVKYSTVLRCSLALINQVLKQIFIFNWPFLRTGLHLVMIKNLDSTMELMMPIQFYNNSALTGFSISMKIKAKLQFIFLTELQRYLPIFMQFVLVPISNSKIMIQIILLKESLYGNLSLKIWDSS